MTSNSNRRAGYTVADVTYLARAVIYITEKVLNATSHSRHRNIVFVVCTDDGLWTNTYFPVAVQIANVVLGRQYGISANEVMPTGFADKLLNVFGFQRNIERRVTMSYSFSIVYSTGHSAWEDLAILSHCNHTIMTVGTFGWWAGFLSGGITVYYKNFPAAGSELSLGFYAEDYFLPEWVGL
jgi:Glycosyl transferase family 11